MPAPERTERQLARERSTRLSRLPFLYDYAQRGQREAVVATVLQAALLIALAVVPARLVTGEWFPTGITLVVLAVAVVMHWTCRALNTRAGRE